MNGGTESGVPETLSPGPAATARPSVLAALRFPFEGPGASRRLLLMSLWQLVPVIGWAALGGWLAETARRLCARHPEPAPMPSLRDLGHYLRIGWAPALVTYLCGAALALLTYVVLALFFLGGLAGMIASSGSALPHLFVLGATLELVLAALGTALASAALTGLELRGGAGEVLTGAWLVRYARRTGFRALLGYALLAPAALLVIAAGFLLCGLGLLPALVVAEMSAVHLRWQIYDHAGQRGTVLLEPRAPALLPSETRALPPPTRERTR